MEPAEGKIIKLAVSLFITPAQQCEQLFVQCYVNDTEQVQEQNWIVLNGLIGENKPDIVTASLVIVMYINLYRAVTSNTSEYYLEITTSNTGWRFITYTGSIFRVYI